MDKNPSKSIFSPIWGENNPPSPPTAPKKNGEPGLTKVTPNQTPQLFKICLIFLSPSPFPPKIIKTKCGHSVLSSDSHRFRPNNTCQIINHKIFHFSLVLPINLKSLPPPSRQS